MLLFAAIALVAYFIPTVIAFVRGHHYRWIVFSLNLFGGWTGVAWLAALVWALWPSEKSLADPLLGNVTGLGTRNTGDTLGAVEAGKARGYAREAGISLTQVEPARQISSVGVENSEILLTGPAAAHEYRFRYKAKPVAGVVSLVFGLGAIAARSEMIGSATVWHFGGVDIPIAISTLVAQGGWWMLVLLCGFGFLTLFLPASTLVIGATSVLIPQPFSKRRSEVRYADIVHVWALRPSISIITTGRSAVISKWFLSSADYIKVIDLLAARTTAAARAAE